MLLVLALKRIRKEDSSCVCARLCVLRCARAFMQAGECLKVMSTRALVRACTCLRALVHLRVLVGTYVCLCVCARFCMLMCARAFVSACVFGGASACL